MIENPHFRQLFEQHAHPLLVISYSYVKDWNTAEDIVQDVFLKYWQQQEQFRGESSLKTYLTRICINACKDYLKSWRYRTHMFTNQFFISTKQKQPLFEQEERSMIGEAVLELPIQLRELVLLYYYENYTYREIAELLTIPESTVRSRLNKAKQQLEQSLPNEQWEVLMDETEA